MKYYRIKPTVEAIQLKPDNLDEVFEFLEKKPIGEYELIREAISQGGMVIESKRANYYDFIVKDDGIKIMDQTDFYNTYQKTPSCFENPFKHDYQAVEFEKLINDTVEEAGPIGLLVALEDFLY